MIFLNLLLSFSFVLCGASVQTENPAEVGPHYRLFTFEKNENPQNIMIIYTKLDSDCRFVENPKNKRQPLMDFYWLMDRSRFKPVHPLIKSGIRSRLEVETSFDYGRSRNHFVVQINDLKKIDPHLQATHLEVRSEKTGGHCEVHSVLNITPEEPTAAFEVDKIFSESEKTWLPPFRHVLSLTISGVNLQTGQKIEKKFTAK